jgi:hypothetical protein
MMKVKASVYSGWERSDKKKRSQEKTPPFQAASVANY